MNVSSPITECDFKTYISSYSGCNGGNQKADLWICAIEPGGETDHEWLSEQAKQGALSGSEHKTPGSWCQKFKDEIVNRDKEKNKKKRKFDDICFDWKVDRGIAKLLMSMDEDGDPSNEDQIKQYMGSKLYSKDGKCLRLNLFPLSCPSENSNKWENYAQLRLCSCLTEKDVYRDICREKRFEFFQSEVKKLEPRVILGIGLGRERDFARAFGFSDPISPKRSETEKITGHSGVERRIEIYRKQGNNCVLIVAPFFGWRKYQISIKYEEDISQLAKIVKKYI